MIEKRRVAIITSSGQPVISSVNVAVQPTGTVSWPDKVDYLGFNCRLKRVTGRGDAIYSIPQSESSETPKNTSESDYAKGSDRMKKILLQQDKIIQEQKDIIEKQSEQIMLLHQRVSELENKERPH